LWVRTRLPLLAGGELVGLERRRVERHLIGCPGCRQRHQALREALGILREAASHAPARLDTPSLWPALARQIRESRRPSPTWTPAWPRAWAWPVLGIASGLLVAVLLLRFRHDTGAHPKLADNTR